MIKAPASSKPFKTLMEWCPSEENLRLAVLAIARNKKRITADDLHVLDVSVDKLGRAHQIYGSILASLGKEGKLHKLNYVASSRVACHNRPVLQWEYVER